MTRVYHSLMTVIVVVLVVLGLNTSNQGTNSLTMENQKPMVSFEMEKESINIVALGEEYSYSSEDVSQESSNIFNKVKEIFMAVIHYLEKIWTIFRVIFLT